jgi:hypothetical protein
VRRRVRLPRADGLVLQGLQKGRLPKVRRRNGQRVHAQGRHRLHQLAVQNLRRDARNVEKIGRLVHQGVWKMQMLSRDQSENYASMRTHRAFHLQGMPQYELPEPVTTIGKNRIMNLPTASNNFSTVPFCL